MQPEVQVARLPWTVGGEQRKSAERAGIQADARDGLRQFRALDKARQGENTITAPKMPFGSPPSTILFLQTGRSLRYATRCQRHELESNFFTDVQETALLNRKPCAWCTPCRSAANA